MDDLDDFATYVGDKCRCDQCGKRFKSNEVVMVSPADGLVFCEAESPETDCVVQYVMFHCIAVSADAMKFHGNT